LVVIPLIRVVLSLIALFFLVIGLRFIATPDAMAAQFALSAADAAGRSTLRGDVGGVFVVVALFIALGLTRATHWLHAAAAVIGAVALGRAVGFVVDGLPPSALAAFALEVTFVVLLLIGARRLATQHPA
jgi:hypothetical protein